MASHTICALLHIFNILLKYCKTKNVTLNKPIYNNHQVDQLNSSPELVSMSH